MFQHGIFLFRLAGIPVHLDLSFLLVLPLWALYIGRNLPHYFALLGLPQDPRLLQEELQPGLRAGFQEGRPVLPCLLLQAEGLPGKEERLLPERPRGRQGSPWKAPPRRWRCRGANPRLPPRLEPRRTALYP